MSEQVRLLINVKAEGAYLPVGTVCNVERRYGDNHEFGASVDLCCGDILFWVHANDVEAIPPTDERK